MKFIIKNKKIFYGGLVYFICILLFIGFRILWGTGVFSSVDPYVSDMIFALCIQVLTFTLLPFVLYKFLTKQTIKQVGENFFFKKINFPTVLYSILTGILVYIIILFVSSFWATLLSIFGYQAGSATAISHLPVWAAFLISIVSTSLLPGFGEEIVHRGMTLGNTKQNGIKRAILLSALLFGLAHLNIAQFGYAFVVGLILGSVTCITRSIFPAMIIHATSNFCSIYMDFAQGNGWLFGDALSNFVNFITSNWVAGLLICFLIIMLVVTLLSVLLVRFYAHTKMQKFRTFCDNLYRDTRNTPMADQINFNDKIFLFTLFSQAAAQDLKQRIERGDTSIEHIEAEVNRSPLNAIMNSELDNFSPTHQLDYLFYYITIFMASLITIITLIWGIF